MRFQFIIKWTIQISRWLNLLTSVCHELHYTENIDKFYYIERYCILPLKDQSPFMNHHFIMVKGFECLLKRGWTLFHSGVAVGERLWVGIDLLIAPWFSAYTLECSLVNERVVSPETVGWRTFLTSRFECLSGQWQCNLEGCEWEEQPGQTEPEWCFVIGLLCKSQFVHKQHVWVVISAFGTRTP